MRILLQSSWVYHSGYESDILIILSRWDRSRLGPHRRCRCVKFKRTSLLCPAPLNGGIKRWWPWSVCPSVCSLPDPKSITEGLRKLKIGGKEAHEMDDQSLHLEVERSTSPGRLTSWPKISRIFGMGMLTYFKLGIQMQYMTHHQQARWPPTGKLWVALQDTTCWGRGHIVAAALQTAQLVYCETLQP